MWFNVDFMRKILYTVDRWIRRWTTLDKERLENNECSPASSGVFINLVSNLERAGDHLNYIAHALVEV